MASDVTRYRALALKKEQALSVSLASTDDKNL